MCNYLFPCKQCQLEDEHLKQRQLYEKSEFLQLKHKWNFQMLQNEQFQSNPTIGNLASGKFQYKPIRFYALSVSWYKEWEKFVQMQTCPLKHQIPGKINNLSICLQQKTSLPSNEPVVYQLNKSEFQLS